MKKGQKKFLLRADYPSLAWMLENGFVARVWRDLAGLYNHKDAGLRAVLSKASLYGLMRWRQV